jgi:hypothetical protein
MARTKTSSWLLPLAIGGGLALLLVASSGKTEPQQQKPQQPPNLPPDLQTQFQTLLAQAQASPQTVNPDQMDALAAQLDAQGFPQQASLLRATAAQVRISQNRPPLIPTGMGPNNALIQNFQALLNKARDPNSTIIVEDMESIGRQLRDQGFLNEAQALQKEADKARQERNPLPCLNPPCPYGPVTINRPVLGAETLINAEGTGFIVPNLPLTESGFIRVRPTSINPNTVDVVVLSYKTTANGPDLPVTANPPIALTIPLTKWKPVR